MIAELGPGRPHSYIWVPVHAFETRFGQAHAPSDCLPVQPLEGHAPTVSGLERNTGVVVEGS